MSCLMALAFALRGAPHLHPVSCAAVVAEWGVAFSGDQGGVLVMWDLTTRKMVGSRRLGCQILALACHVPVAAAAAADTAADALLYVQQRNGEIAVFRTTANTLSECPVSRMECAEYTYCHAALAPDSRLMAVPVDESRSVAIVDCVTKEVIADDFPKAFAHGSVMALAVRSDRVAVGFEDGHVMLYQIDAPAMTAAILLEHKAFDDSVTCLAFDADSRIFAGGSCNCIKSVEMRPDGAVEEVCSAQFRDPGIASVVPFKDRVYTGGWDGKIRVFCRKTLKMLHFSDDFLFSSVMHLSLSTLRRPIAGANLMRPVDSIMIACSKDLLLNVWEI